MPKVEKKIVVASAVADYAVAYRQKAEADKVLKTNRDAVLLQLEKGLETFTYPDGKIATLTRVDASRDTGVDGTVAQKVLKDADTVLSLSSIDPAKVGAAVKLGKITAKQAERLLTPTAYSMIKVAIKAPV